MAVAYPDAIGEYIASSQRFVAGSVQYTGYFEPAKIAPGQITHLCIFLQNVFNIPTTANLKVNVPQSGGFLRGGKDLLAIGESELEIKLAAGEAGLLTLPVTTTEHTNNGEHELTIVVKANTQKGAKRVRPPQSKSKLSKGLIDNPVGLNIVGSLGATYVEKSVKKAPFALKVAGNPQPATETPKLKHNYESLWQAEEAKLFNQAVQELNLRQVKLKDELKIEALYANLYGETTTRFTRAGLPLRIGEAIVLAKILTQSCQYFLGNPNRRNGLLVPIWEQAFREEANTTDSLDVIRTIGYYHILKLSIAMSFGQIAQAFGRHFWSLEERQGVAEHISETIETAQTLDPDFLYIPLLMAGTLISGKFKLKGENSSHTLALIKQASQTRPELFSDKDMAQPKKIYNHILKKALS